MTKVQALESEVQNLTPEELAEFRSWFADYDSEVWDRQIEAEGDIAVAVVFEAVKLLVGLFAAFSQEDFRIFERRRIDRREPITAVDVSRFFEKAFARNHDLGRIIAEAL